MYFFQIVAINVCMGTIMAVFINWCMLYKGFPLIKQWFQYLVFASERVFSLIIGDRSGLKTRNLVSYWPTRWEIFVPKLRGMALLVCVAGTVEINVSIIGQLR